MKTRFWFIVLSVFAIAGLGLAACGTTANNIASATEEAVSSESPVEEASATDAAVVEEAPADGAAEPVTITYMDTSGFYTLDIFQTPWFNLTQTAMYDTLVNLTPDGKTWEGILVDSWETAEDGLSMTFKAKEGITFHDGTPWNADAAVWNLSKYLDPAWPKGINQDWPNVISSWEKIDEMTFKVNFISPYATLFGDLVNTFIVSPTAYETLGQDGFGAAPVGTGAWIPIEIVPNDHVMYKKNPAYSWGPSWTDGQPAAADFLKIVYNTDQAVAYAALETGEVTYTDLPAQYLQTADENPDIDVNVGTSGSLFYLGVNYKKEIFQNEDFRKAVMYGIERDEIILAAFEGEAYKTCQFVPAGTPGYNVDTDAYACEMYPYDPAKSNEILDGLGWLDTNGDGVREKDGTELVFSLVYSTEEALARAAEVIQGQLSDIGISVELEPMEAAAQSELLKAEQQDFFIRQYGYPDPVILSWMVTYPNRNAYDDAAATELRMVADSSMDNDVRMAAVDDLNRYLIDTAAWFPLWTPYSYIAYRNNMQGAVFDFQGYILLNKATIVK